MHISGPTRESPGTFVECPGVWKECPGEITYMMKDQMILVIYGIAKYCLRLSQKNARESERNTRGKITQVIMLVNDKNVF